MQGVALRIRGDAGKALPPVRFVAGAVGRGAYPPSRGAHDLRMRQLGGAATPRHRGKTIAPGRWRFTTPLPDTRPYRSRVLPLWLFAFDH